jgi:hypothetical protein
VSYNPYYHPEKCGLTKVDEINDPEAEYSFKIACLWKRNSGGFLFGIDSGCSCSSPFDYATPETLTEIRSVGDLRAELDHWYDVGKYDDIKEGLVSAYINAGGTR